MLLGGLTRDSSLGNIVFGYQNGVTQKFNFNSNTMFTDYYFKTGDAILYPTEVNPMLTSTSFTATTAQTTVYTGAVDGTTAGKIKNMNGYPFPNRLRNVLDGFGNTIQLPFRCSDTNFTMTDVYGWN
jgi:hypothetical protein